MAEAQWCITGRMLAFAAAVACTAATGAGPERSHDHGSHNHGTVSVDDPDQAPAVRIEVQRDAMSGWNVHIVTRNFRFAPEHVNVRHVEGEGHAHIYVDGRKVARVYGPWYHLDGLESGKHEIRVTLNANTHEEYAVGDKVIDTTLSIEQ